MVNRVWRWHFGQGLVRIAGQLRPARRAADAPGAARLARAAVRRGRLVAQGAAPADHALGDLPDEQPRTTRRPRAPTRRTACCGGRTSGGWRPRRSATRSWRSAGCSTAPWAARLLHVKNRDYLFDHTSKDQTTYDERPPLGLPAGRSATTCTTCSSCSTSPTRPCPTATAPRPPCATQALFLLNSDLVDRRGRRAWPDGCSRAPTSTTPAASRGCTRRAYGRPPTRRRSRPGARPPSPTFETALRRDEPDAGEAPARRRGQRSARRSLAANEFVYVRVTRCRWTRSADLPLAPRRRCCDSPRSGSARWRWPSLLAEDAADAADPLARKAPHFAPRAKRVIFLFMKGGPSHVDTFDYKPLLDRDDGKPLPFGTKPRVAVRQDRQPAQVAVEVPAARPERHRGQRAVPARRAAASTTSASSTRCTAPTRPTAARC